MDTAKRNSIAKRLENFGNGAIVHTARKCAGYILNEDNNKRYPDSVVKIIKLAEQSMNSNNWKELHDYLRECPGSF